MSHFAFTILNHQSFIHLFISSIYCFNVLTCSNNFPIFLPAQNHQVQSFRLVFHSVAHWTLEDIPERLRILGGSWPGSGVGPPFQIKKGRRRKSGYKSYHELITSWNVPLLQAMDRLLHRHAVAKRAACSRPLRIKSNGYEPPRRKGGCDTNPWTAPSLSTGKNNG